MKISIKKFNSDAMKWIYQGYYNAFKDLGCEVEFFETSKDIKNPDIIFDYISPDILNHKDYNNLLLFVSPNKFPGKWNNHQNYVSNLAKDKNIVDLINQNSKITKWTFCDFSNVDFWSGWNELVYLPLAFDDISYNFVDEPPKYDVFYCGGWADNGYNSKKKRIISYLSQFKDKGLKCGFYINKNLSHEDENLFLSTSKVCINIHDDYQEILGLDTNERTFKALGLNGSLVSDRVTNISSLKLPAHLVDTPSEMYDKVIELIDNNSEKQANRELILKEHTYRVRAKKLLESI